MVWRKKTLDRGIDFDKYHLLDEMGDDHQLLTCEYVSLQYLNKENLFNIAQTYMLKFLAFIHSSLKSYNSQVNTKTSLHSYGNLPTSTV